MKAFLLRSISGIGIGAIILCIVTVNMVVFGEVSTLDGDLYVKNALGSLLCGWFFAVASMIFEIKRLILWQQTLIHFIFISVLYFVFANWIGWVPYDEKIFFTMIFIFISFYLVFWISFYIYYSRLAKKMNNNLNQL